jgi:CBS domain-containing protein
MTIKKICNSKVITAPVDTSIYEISSLMKKYNIGNIVIIDDKNKPIGIITDRDIVTKVIANDIDQRNLAASDIMSIDLLLLKEYQGIQESLEMMCAKGVRRAPVVNDVGILMGIVSIDDLALLIADEMESYAKLIRKQVSRK